MTGTLRILSLAAAGLMLSGCVSAEKYNALKLDRDRIASQLTSSDSNLRDAQGRLSVLQQQLAAISGTTGSKDAMVLNLTQQNSDLQARLEEMNRRYQEALNRPISANPLPEALTNELTAFANQNPNLVEFDASRGIVKFRSDVTFSVGDAELTANAKQVIARFATILNSSAARQYELQVAGHTDNTPVRNPQTIAKGHKNNWYLSAHRAISVSTALIGDGVSANRIGAIGYADQHPVAPNNTAAGQAKNRRVEVLILPTTVSGPVVAPGGRQSAAPAAGSANHAAQPNKDGVQAAPQPAFNK